MGDEERIIKLDNLREVRIIEVSEGVKEVISSEVDKNAFVDWYAQIQKNRIAGLAPSSSFLSRYRVNEKGIWYDGANISHSRD